MTDEEAQMIADAVVAKLDTLPRELQETLQPGMHYATPIPTQSQANYALLKTVTDTDGIWVVFELNSYRLYERKFFYSDKYFAPHQR